jgi:Ran GTPase-activating protein (RanGAP) involved in mRNA processing and transport
MFSEERESWVRRLTTGNLIGQLETLRLRSTDVTDEGVRTLARCRCVKSLRHLDLSGNSIGEDGLRELARSKTLAALTTLDLRENQYDTEGGVATKGCNSEIRHLLEGRFGAGLLLDGKADPHPIDELFRSFT